MTPNCSVGVGAATDGSYSHKTWLQQSQNASLTYEQCYFTREDVGVVLFWLACSSHQVVEICTLTNLSVCNLTFATI